MNIKFLLSVFIVSLAFISCKDEEKTTEELLPGYWKIEKVESTDTSFLSGTSDTIFLDFLSHKNLLNPPIYQFTDTLKYKVRVSHEWITEKNSKGVLDSGYAKTNFELYELLSEDLIEVNGYEPEEIVFINEEFLTIRRIFKTPYVENTIRYFFRRMEEEDFQALRKFSK
jgi:hypothetical protein